MQQFSFASLQLQGTQISKFLMHLSLQHPYRIRQCCHSYEIHWNLGREGIKQTNPRSPQSNAHYLTKSISKCCRITGDPDTACFLPRSFALALLSSHITGSCPKTHSIFVKGWSLTLPLKSNPVKKLAVSAISPQKIRISEVLLAFYTTHY